MNCSWCQNLLEVLCAGKIIAAQNLKTESNENIIVSILHSLETLNCVLEIGIP